MNEFNIKSGTLLSYNGTAKNITIPHGVKKIAKKAFQNNKDIVNVTINKELEEVGFMAFANCTNLKSIVFPKKKMLLLDKCFYKCISLETITLPLITSLAPGLFQYCRSLKTIDIPNTVKKICLSVFKKCDHLQSIQIPPSVKEINSFAFSYCTNLKFISLEGNHCPLKTNSLHYCKPEILWKGAGVFANEAKKGFIINKNGLLMRYVGTEKNIVIPKCVTGINDYAFMFNPSISTVLITGNVISLGHHVFADCNCLEKIVFENGVRTVDTCLCSGCKALKEISFSDTIEYIGNNAITHNDEIREVVFPNSMTNMSQILDCNKLERIRLSKNTKELWTNSIMYCHNLKTIEISKDTIIRSYQAIHDCGEFKISKYE